MDDKIVFITLCLALILSVEYAGGSIDSFKRDVQLFYTCNGKTTVMQDFQQRKLTPQLTCMAGVTKARYCQYKCVLQKYGFMDAGGTPTPDNIPSNLYNEETPKIIQAMKDCAKANNNTRNDEFNCLSTRKFLYCYNNEYIKICNSTAIPKSIEKASEENGVVGNTVGAVGATQALLDI